LNATTESPVWASDSTLQANSTAGETLAERASLLLEQDIVRGELIAEQRLGVASLSERYSIGPTPIREALSRLVMRGFVDAIPHKGFRVAALSSADLADITELRVLIETDALRRSMELGSDEWEADVVAAFHRLQRAVEREPAGMLANAPEFEGLHRDFHRALIGACGSQRFMRIHDELYLQALRYRCIVMKKFVDRDLFIHQHKVITEAVIKRKEEAVHLVEQHARQICKIIYGN
jgi:GntR family transcriptional regulator, carbon starvation induced regulator